MFNKKRKLAKFKFKYGKSPSLTQKDLKTKGYYSKKLQRRSHPYINKIKKIVIGITIIVLSILAVNLIFFSDYLKIKEITVLEEVEENTAISQEIQSILQPYIGKNLLFTDTDDIQIKISNFLPEIESIEVDKNYPSSIEIIFKEYPAVANVINESSLTKKTFVINSIGYAIKEDMESPALPYIYIQSDEPLNQSAAILEANKLKYILDTITYFEDKFGMRIVKVIYKKTPREIHLITERDFAIWLDIQLSAEEQLKKLKKALVKLDIYTENLEYIDLRIAGGNGDKIIYKRR